VVVENASEHFVGVQVKATASIKESDLRGLRKLPALASAKFKMAVLLFDGEESMPLGDNILAAAP
jgi:hypothetical protein